VTRRWLAVVAFVTIVPAAAHAAIPGRAKAATSTAPDSTWLLATTNAMLDAITTGDSTKWAPFLARDWIITDEEGGQTGRAEFVAGLHPLPAGQSGELDVGRWTMRRRAQTVVFSYDIEESHNFYGQHLQTRFHNTDVWVPDGDRWRMIASQVTALPTPIEGVAVPAAVLQRYVGEYELTPEIHLTIAATDSGLTLQRGTRPADRLYALNDRTFIRHHVRGFLLFESGQGGAVTRMVQWRDNNAVVWKRRR
jgi:hypothetical protein